MAKEDYFEVSITRHEKGSAPLHETLTGDAELAVVWLRATADELERERRPQVPACTDHRLVQHRDRRPAWCDTCRRDGSGALIPPRLRSAVDLPARLHHWLP